MAVMESNWRAATAYAFSKRERDDDGVRTYRVMMMLGTFYQELLTVNGRPLSAADRVKEHDKRARELDRRRSESPERRANRLRKFQEDRDREHRIFEAIPRAFSYTMLGQRRDGDRIVDVLVGRVRPSYDPPTVEARVLMAMNIEIWIDPRSLQWTRVTALVTAPVSIGGFLASVDRGTRFELEQAPVGAGVWLPKRFETRQRGSFLLMFHHRSDDVDEFFDYRRQADQ